jgi:hypothetical protein
MHYLLFVFLPSSWLNLSLFPFSKGGEVTLSFWITVSAALLHSYGKGRTLSVLPFKIAVLPAILLHLELHPLETGTKQPESS